VSIRFEEGSFALILGGSSGFGLATAKKLARAGMNVAIVHRDRKGAMPAIERELAAIRDTGVTLLTWNLDALSDEGRKTVLDDLAAHLGSGKVRLLLHSIAFGNLKLLAPLGAGSGEAQSRARARLAERLGVAPDALAAAVEEVLGAGADPLAALAAPPAYSEDAFLEDEDFARTVYSMGTSLVTWAQDVLRRGLFCADARVVGMTSEGNEVAWRGYAAVSAAKAALEACARSMAVELAPFGVRTNVVQAGVTDTPALRLIPGSDRMKASARLRNPFGRLTTPEDIADFIALLCTDEARWVNGAVLRVDGGEHISG